VRVVELRCLEVVLSAFVVAFGDHVDVPGVLRSLVLALGGGDVHLGEVRVLAALQHLAAHFDDLAVEGRVGADQGGAFALVFVEQGGAVDVAEHVARLDRVASAHLIDDGAGGLGEQRGTRRGHDQAGGGDVPYEGPALDHRDAQPFFRNDLLG